MTHEHELAHQVRQHPGSLTLSVDEVAEALGVSRGLAYEAVRQGEIPSIRVGKRILVPRHAFSLMLERAGASPSRLAGGTAAIRDGSRESV